ncbi:hypothetical protein EVAR_66244_1 [Eumeta japonica]|uniref:Uncharacterized protein n=1 Tax=Eumeta variegata TaxID=151549 RepID=A0A4C1ZX69_EUMVA|nr:hypothetical protein EVAR_66244_1 [Eumeta japonica]
MNVIHRLDIKKKKSREDEINCGRRAITYRALPFAGPILVCRHDVRHPRPIVRANLYESALTQMTTAGQWMEIYGDGPPEARPGSAVYT